jgi:hypothetical protein
MIISRGGIAVFTCAVWRARSDEITFVWGYVRRASEHLSHCCYAVMQVGLEGQAEIIYLCCVAVQRRTARSDWRVVGLQGKKLVGSLASQAENLRSSTMTFLSKESADIK